MISGEAPQYLVDPSEPSSRFMLGEPITLGSGDVLTIYGRHDSDTIEFSVDGRTSFYSPTDLAIIGEGDYRQGMMQVARHYHLTDGADAQGGLPKPFQDVILAVRLGLDE